MNNKIVGLGSPHLEILASICSLRCEDSDSCVENCPQMLSLMESLFELQKQAGYEVYEEEIIKPLSDPEEGFEEHCFCNRGLRQTPNEKKYCSVHGYEYHSLESTAKRDEDE